MHVETSLADAACICTHVFVWGLSASSAILYYYVILCDLNCLLYKIDLVMPQSWPHPSIVIVLCAQAPVSNGQSVCFRLSMKLCKRDLMLTHSDNNEFNSSGYTVHLQRPAIIHALALL